MKIKLTATLVAVLGFTIAAQATLTTGLVGYYDGESNNNNAIASHPASLGNLGVAVNVVGGKVGGAFEFDDTQTDMLQAATSYGLGDTDLGETFTVGAWYNLDTDASRIGGRHFVFENAGDYDFSYWIKNQGLGATETDREMFVDNATTTLASGYEKGTWEHVLQTMVTAGGTTTVSTYLNGAFAGSDNGPTASMGSLISGFVDSGINFGRARTPASDRPFDGKIDEIVIYDRELTLAEITQVVALGNAGLAIPEPSTFALLAVFGGAMLSLRRRLSS